MDQVTKESRSRLKDLAILCNCKIYDKNITQKAQIIANPKDYIGFADKIIVNPKSTQVIFSEDITPEHRKIIDKELTEIEKELKKFKDIDSPTVEENEQIYALRKRRSRLTGSTAILHVGGRTLTERMTRQRLIEDSIFASKSAINYGYIPGGNLCIPKILISEKEGIASVLGVKYSYLPIKSIRSFFGYFVDLVADSFLESYRAVLNNSYMNEEDVEKTIYECINNNKFYNLKLHRYEDFDKTLIINSTETDIQILRSCFSIIGILSTSNQFITRNTSNVYDALRKNA